MIDYRSLNGPNKFAGTDPEKAMTYYSESAKRKMRAYIERMNSLYGYPLYGLPQNFDIQRTFGVGSFGLPIVLLSIIPLILPFWLFVATIETGFPGLAIFGFQITFLPLQILGYVIHLAMAFLGGMICKKFSMCHYGAARGVDVYKFVFWDISVRIVTILAGIFHFTWLMYLLFA